MPSGRNWVCAVNGSVTVTLRRKGKCHISDEESSFWVIPTQPVAPGYLLRFSWKKIMLKSVHV